MNARWLVVVATTMMACAERPPATPTPAPVEAQAPIAQEPTAPVVTSSADRPPGELVCRSVKPNGAAMELFLQWDGAEAAGVLRETAVTGLVHDQRVRAERQQNVIVADDIHEHDLVVHAAVVVDRGGKKTMRVGDQSSACQ